MDGFDLTGIEVPSSVHASGYGAVVHKGRPLVSFEWRAKENRFKSQEEGRPVFENRLFAIRRVIGRKDQPADLEVKFITNSKGKLVPDPMNKIVRTYPMELKRFLESNDAPSEGTPLNQWSRLSRERVAVCNFLEIRTIEELASCEGNDAVIQKLGPGGRELIAQAVAYLRHKDDSSVAEKIAAEKEQLKQEYDRKFELMQQQLQQLTEKLSEPKAEAAPRARRAEKAAE